MKNLYKNLLNKALNIEDYGYFVIPLALVLHISFMIIFYYIGIYEMFVINIISSLIYGFLTFTFKSEKSQLYYTITYVEILLHQLAGMYYTGAASGFDLLLCCLILIQFLFFKKSICVASTVLLISIIYINYFELNNTLIHSPKLFSDDVYMDSNIVLYPINMATLFMFLIAYGLLVTTLPSKKINDLKHLIYKDFLTGLNNRKFVEDSLLPALNGEQIAIAICDIDDFKHINDTYGHQTGDVVLKIIAIVFSDKIKKYQNLAFEACRWGGEEFLLVLKCAEIEMAKRVLEEVREDISALKIGMIKEQISVTIGGTLARLNVKDYKQMFEIADKNLYLGKNTGKNKCVITRA